jgi:hypothetical protein
MVVAGWLGNAAGKHTGILDYNTFYLFIYLKIQCCRTIKVKSIK